MNPNKQHAIFGELLAAALFHLLENDNSPELHGMLTNMNPDKLAAYLVKRNQAKHAELLARGTNTAQPQPQAGPSRKVLANQPVSQGGAPSHPRTQGNAPAMPGASTQAADLFRSRQ
jgi:hypothetical protein